MTEKMPRNGISVLTVSHASGIAINIDVQLTATTNANDLNSISNVRILKRISYSSDPIPTVRINRYTSGRAIAMTTSVEGITIHTGGRRASVRCLR